MRIDLDKYEFNTLGSVEISKGTFTFPVLTLMGIVDVEDAITSYKLIEHKKASYPTRSSLVRLTEAEAEDFTWRTVSLTEAEILGDAMRSWEIDKNNRLMGYSYLYAYCRAKGLDLHEDLKIKE